MAMTMNGEVQLAATRELVWAKLNDADVLKACPRLLTVGCFCIGTNQVDTKAACLAHPN